MTELKPCPFCGAKPILAADYDGDRYYWRPWDRSESTLLGKDRQCHTHPTLKFQRWRKIVRAALLAAIAAGIGLVMPWAVLFFTWYWEAILS